MHVIYRQGAFLDLLKKATWELTDDLHTTSEWCYKIWGVKNVSKITAPHPSTPTFRLEIFFKHFCIHAHLYVNSKYSEPKLTGIDLQLEFCSIVSLSYLHSLKALNPTPYLVILQVLFYGVLNDSNIGSETANSVISYLLMPLSTSIAYLPMVL
jgi:hypothetical protein